MSSQSIFADALLSAKARHFVRSDAVAACVLPSSSHRDEFMVVVQRSDGTRALSDSRQLTNTIVQNRQHCILPPTSSLNNFLTQPKLLERCDRVEWPCGMRDKTLRPEDSENIFKYLQMIFQWARAKFIIPSKEPFRVLQLGASMGQMNRGLCDIGRQKEQAVELHNVELDGEKQQLAQIFFGDEPCSATSSWWTGDGVKRTKELAEKFSSSDATDSKKFDLVVDDMVDTFAENTTKWLAFLGDVKGVLKTDGTFFANLFSHSSKVLNRGAGEAEGDVCPVEEVNAMMQTEVAKSVFGNRWEVVAGKASGNHYLKISGMAKVSRSSGIKEEIFL